jgi:hypothetical protein
MIRIIAVFGVLLILLGCSGAGWVAASSPLALFVVPDATDIQVVRQGWAEWQISYDAPSSPTTWYTDIADQLEAQHWGSLDRVEYGSLTRTYSRALSFGFCELWEWSYLHLDPLRPQVAQIKVRRWIVIPWWRSLA